MKKNVLLHALFLLLVSNADAQMTKEPRGSIKFGTGYFLDIIGIYGGKSIWIEGGYKLPNKIIISANIMRASVRYEYFDVAYLGHYHITVHQNYTLNLSYEFNKKAKHKFAPGIGFLYNHIDISRVGYNNSLWSGTHEELGINLNLDYYYQFKNNFFIGARVNTVYLISIGLESFIFSPIFGVKF